MSEHVEPKDSPRDAGTEQSLWHPLHGAFLVGVASGRLARLVTFEFDIAHLEKFEGLGAGVRWRLVMQDVTMLLARTWQIWPGPALPGGHA